MTEYQDNVDFPRITLGTRFCEYEVLEQLDVDDFETLFHSEHNVRGYYFPRGKSAEEPEPCVDIVDADSFKDTVLREYDLAEELANYSELSDRERDSGATDLFFDWVENDDDQGDNYAGWARKVFEEKGWEAKY